MNRELYDQIVVEEKKLEKTAMILREKIENAPDGKLRVMKAKGKYYQHYVYKKDSKGIASAEYLKKGDISIAKALAQRKYDEKILAITEKRLNALKHMKLAYEPQKDEVSIFADLGEAYKQLIDPHEKDDETYVKEWYESKKCGGNTYETHGNRHTERGEDVRSKTEKIIADKLYRRNIPYIYEPVLELRDGHVVYPDFLTLNVRLRKEIYWEHFGMMDNIEYAEKTTKKIDDYEKNDFWYGKNILYTFETVDYMPDDRNIDALISRFLI